MPSIGGTGMEGIQGVPEMICNHVWMDDDTVDGVTKQTCVRCGIEREIII